MGSAGSIENAQYDADKFQQSKAIMESGTDDGDKFTKLKAIWGTGCEGGQASGEATGHADQANAQGSDTQKEEGAPKTGDALKPADDNKAGEQHAEAQKGADQPTTAGEQQGDVPAKTDVDSQKADHAHDAKSNDGAHTEVIDQHAEKPAH